MQCAEAEALELSEIAGELSRFDGVYVVDACRAPEEDLAANGWGIDESDLGWTTDPASYYGEFLDDRSGKPLDSTKVREAREEELRELERRGVYEVVDVDECWRVKNKPPIKVRWVDVDKGFGVYRSRLVAKDFKPKSSIGDRDGLFAAMPPLEAVKLLIVQAAAESRNSGQSMKLMFIDIGKAHLCGPMESDEFVELPGERAVPGKCAKLRYTLYGMRMAASNWEKEYSRTLTELGLAKGVASSVTFYCARAGVRVIVHGDDFIMSGSERELWKGMTH